MTNRTRLQLAATKIAANFDKPLAAPRQALRKLFVARRWTAYSVRAPGLRRWKAGELAECASALLHRDRTALAKEWGDVGYFVAQTWRWLWWLYEAITPGHVIEAAVQKFEQRAR